MRVVCMFMLLLMAAIAVNAQEDSPTGVVTNGPLNVRTAPATSGAIITQIRFGEEYAVTGRSADSAWWQIQLNAETRGWVSAAYFAVSNGENAPIVNEITTLPTAPAQLTVITTQGVNVRSGPGTNFTIIGGLPEGSTVQPIGRSVRATWVQIHYRDTTGWIIAGVIPDAEQPHIANLPIPIEAIAAEGGLNWRITTTTTIYAGNNIYYPKLGTLHPGDTVRVLGRDWSDDWVRIDMPGGGDEWIAAAALDPEFDILTLPVYPYTTYR